MSKRIHFLANSKWSTVACGRELNSSVERTTDRASFARMAKAGTACVKCVTRVGAMQDDEATVHEDKVARENDDRVVMHVKRSYNENDKVIAWCGNKFRVSDLRVTLDADRFDAHPHKCAKCAEELEGWREEQRTAQNNRKQRDLSNEAQNAMAVIVRRNLRSIEELEARYLNAVNGMTRALEHEARRVRDGSNASTTIMLTSLVQDIEQLPLQMRLLRGQVTQLKEMMELCGGEK